jgi:predicted O-linked N-acetylglucosamine transferase (SPINDLY family)
MDYLISDETTIPVGEEAYYVEAVVRLPSCRFCYSPPDYAPSPRLGSPMESRVTFGSFNNLAKIGPDTLTLWAQVLQAAPRSRLLLKWKSLDDEETCRRILHDFLKLGIDSARLTLRGASPHPMMLEEYGDIDIALDPIPFSGGLTSCEALWMGVPVITLAGDMPQSRQTAGILKASNRTDLIAGTRNAYVAIASRLAERGRQTTEARLELRRQIAQSSLCDAPTFTRSLEAVFRDIWRYRSAL